MGEFYNNQWRLPNNENKDKSSNYSMSFDSASSNWIELNDSNILNGLTAFSVSLWLNPSATQAAYTSPFSFKSANTEYLKLNFGATPSNNQLEIAFRNSATATATSSVNSIPLNTWTNVIVVFDASSSLSLYVNGSLDGQDTSGLPTSVAQSTNIYIGTDAGNTTRIFNGKIDHVAIFDYALSSSQITTLYGNSTDGVGNPMSLSTKPVAYYKLGEKAAFNGSEYLVTNSASEVFSPYALEFDGTDYIDVPTINLGTIQTLSWWIYRNSSSTQECPFGSTTSGLTNMLVYMNGLTLYYRVGTTNLGWINALSSTLTNQKWCNIILVRNGASAKLYLNGNFVSEKTLTGGDITSLVQIDRIGASSATTAAFEIHGKMSNIAIYNAALTDGTGSTPNQISELYNSGKPSDLKTHSAASNLVSWWQLGANSSFNSQWTVLDEVGTSNGTSNGMAENDLVNGPETTANGLSSGMGSGDNVIGEAPFSDGNSISYGMGVEARTDDTPS